jgi:hypothetical protein
VAASGYCLLSPTDGIWLAALSAMALPKPLTGDRIRPPPTWITDQIFTRMRISALIREGADPGSHPDSRQEGFV